MASVLAGFRPVKHMNGSPYNGQFNRYMISASDSQVTNIGDLVILSDNDDKSSSSIENRSSDLLGK